MQKTNIIRDYLEDINEIPKCRMFWPREIWSKYVNKLEVSVSASFACVGNLRKNGLDDLDMLFISV